MTVKRVFISWKEGVFKSTFSVLITPLVAAAAKSSLKIDLIHYSLQIHTLRVYIKLKFWWKQFKTLLSYQNLNDFNYSPQWNCFKLLLKFNLNYLILTENIMSRYSSRYRKSKLNVHVDLITGQCLTYIYIYTEIEISCTLFT